MRTRMRQLRRERSLSQEELGRLVNVSQETISHLEKGLTGMNEDLGARLCEVLECNLDDLRKDGIVINQKKKNNFAAIEQHNHFDSKAMAEMSAAFVAVLQSTSSLIKQFEAVLQAFMTAQDHEKPGKQG